MFSATPMDFRGETIEHWDQNIVDQYLMANEGLENLLNSPDNSWDLLVKNRDKLPPMYFSCGTDDIFYKLLYVKFKEYALAEKLPFTFSDVPGYIHEWRFWDKEIEKALEKEELALMSVEDIIKKVCELNNPNTTMVVKSTIPVGFIESMKEKYNINNIFFSP